MKGLDVDAHKHSRRRRSPRGSKHAERVKALVASESQGRAVESRGMLRNATESVNQADTTVHKRLENIFFVSKGHIISVADA